MWAMWPWLTGTPIPLVLLPYFTGCFPAKKSVTLNVFPKPGISDEDISGTMLYGEIISGHLQTNQWEGLQQQLVDKDAVHINYPLMVIESKARYIFAAWAKVIVNRKNRIGWTTAFKYYLFIALFLGAPILLTLDALFLKPFTGKSIRLKKQQFLLLN